MKLRFETFYRLGLALLLGIAFWSVWASAHAAPATNLPPVPRAAPAVENGAATFGLD